MIVFQVSWLSQKTYTHVIRPGTRVIYCCSNDSQFNATTQFSHALELHFIQCPFPNRFQFGSEKISIKFSKPNPVWFGRKIAIFQQTKIPNRFQFGSEFCLTIVNSASQNSSIIFTFHCTALQETTPKFPGCAHAIFDVDT